MAKNVLALCVLLSAQTALANQITQVSAGAGSVRITADEPPNFTTFTIDYPPRLVIDVAGATLVDVPTNIQVGQAGVTGIQTLPYGSGTSAVARIIIMYDKPVQTDILTDGNSIVVKQAETAVAATPPAAARPPPAPQPAAPAPQPVQQAAALPPPPTPAAAPAPPVPAAPTPPSPRPAAREPVLATAAPSQPPRNPERAAPEEPVQSAPPPSTVVSDNQPPYPEEPVAPPAAPPPEVPPPSQPVPPPAPALARAETPVRVNTQANLASPPPPAPTGEAPQVTARRKTLSLVGLRFNNGAMSVFVRTNEPVSYHVSEKPNGLVVTIENTRIRRRNDSRPLDAHFFDSPIAKVQAVQNRGDVEVNIDLKTHAAYQATQAGPEVELSFNRG